MKIYKHLPEMTNVIGDGGFSTVYATTTPKRVVSATPLTDGNYYGISVLSKAVTACTINEYTVRTGLGRYLYNAHLYYDELRLYIRELNLDGRLNNYPHRFIKEDMRQREFEITREIIKAHNRLGIQTDEDRSKVNIGYLHGRIIPFDTVCPITFDDDTFDTESTINKLIHMFDIYGINFEISA